MRVIVVTTDNKAYITEVKQPYHKSIGDIVGGYIEVVHPQGLEEDMCMVVNEEGLIVGLPFNTLGCILYRTSIHGSPIAGNIVITRESYTPDGVDFVDFDDDELEYVYQQITGLDFITKG